MQQMLQQLLAMQEKEDANRKADLEEMKADREKIQAEMKAMYDKRMETRRDDRKESTACQDAVEGSIKAVVEWQKIPNEEVAVHSLRAYRSKAVASQGAAEANTEKTDPDKRNDAVCSGASGGP
jgi:hypothetical protein